MNLSLSTRFWAVVPAASLCCAALVVERVRAEVFLLKSGGQVEGTLLNPDQTPRTGYQISTSGGQLTLSKDLVRQVIEKSDEQVWYEKWLPKMPQDAGGNWIMAEQCAKRGLKDQRKYHLEQAIELDPEHEPSRRALGYERINGKWQRREDYWAERGYVKYKGSWRLKQDVEKLIANEERKQEEVEWKKNIRRWRSWIVKPKGREQQAVANFRAIDDPMAAETLAILLNNNKEPRRLKLLYIEPLGRLKSPHGTDAFLRRALNDNDEDVRDRCLDELAKWDTQFAVSVFTKALETNNLVTVRRAATGLGRIGGAQATLPLIDALVVEHKSVAPTQPGNMSASFNDDGLDGFQFGGGGMKIIKRDVRLREALNALAYIHSGVNHGFDKAAWRNWYAETNAPGDYHLRRAD